MIKSDKSGYFIFVNYKNCTGCRICELSCSLFNYGECNTVLSRIRVKTATYDGRLYHAPTVCFNCIDAPCEKACPTGATRRDENSNCMIVDSELCIGCKGCVFACPFGACFMDTKNDIAMRCHQCEGRPTCVLMCPKDALNYISYSKSNINVKAIKNIRTPLI